MSKWSNSTCLPSSDHYEDWRGADHEGVTHGLRRDEPETRVRQQRRSSNCKVLQHRACPSSPLCSECPASWRHSMVRSPIAIEWRPLGSRTRPSPKVRCSELWYDLLEFYELLKFPAISSNTLQIAILDGTFYKLHLSTVLLVWDFLYELVTQLSPQTTKHQ